jgi:hypothetical protein
VTYPPTYRHVDQLMGYLAYERLLRLNLPPKTTARAALSSSRSISNSPKVRVSGLPPELGNRDQSRAAIESGEGPPRPGRTLVVRRVGSRALGLDIPTLRRAGRGKLGKNLCRRVQPRAGDEAVTVTAGAEAPLVPSVRMAGIGVPAGRAEDNQVGAARWPEGVGLRHAPTVSQLGDAIHRPKGGTRRLVERL